MHSKPRTGFRATMNLMRSAIALLVLALSASMAEMKIDHVTVAGANVEEMRKAFNSVSGVPTEYGGSHSNHATEMDLASFPDGSYIELMGIQKQADPAAVTTHTWSQFLRDNGGPCAFALRVPDVSAEIRRLSTAGIRVGDAEKSGRTRPDGVALSWETADIGFGAAGIILPVSDPRFHTARETGVPIRQTNVKPVPWCRTRGDRRPKPRRFDCSVSQSVPSAGAEATAGRIIWCRSRMVRGNSGGTRCWSHAQLLALPAHRPLWQLPVRICSHGG